MPNNPNKPLALSLLMLFTGMVFLAYSAVPLYSLFCKVTGYGGTTNKAIKLPQYRGTRKIKIKFDANVDENLPWKFKPEQKEITVMTGETALVFYSAQNLEPTPIIGTSVYNVTPFKAGSYFSKIECFCFSEQLLLSNQHTIMPVSFFIDPEIEKDPNLRDVNEITLSYTFYKIR